MRDPERMLDSPDTPEQLVAALRALGERVPSSDALGRAQHALRSAASSEPLASPLTAAAKLSIAGAGTASLIILVALVVYGRPLPTPTPTSASATALSPSTPTPAEPVSVASQPALTEPAAIGSNEPSPRKRRSARTSRPKPAPAGPVQTNASPQRFEADASSEQLSEPAAPSAAAGARRDEASRHEPEAASAAAPQDEAGLLYRAKRLAKVDAAGALTLLELHARHFPSGFLVEEREALSIRLHLKLGHEERARQLAHAFRVRFPSSVYSSGLPP